MTENTKKLTKKDAYKVAFEYLKNNPNLPGISQQIYSELTGVTSRTTFNNYIKYLKDSGYSLSKTKNGKEVYYKIDNLSDMSAYETMTAEDYYKYIISETLERNTSGMLIKDPVVRSKERSTTPRTKSSVFNHKYLLNEIMLLGNKTEDDCYSAKIPINIGETTLRELLKKMVDTGSISVVNLGTDGNLYRANSSNSMLNCDSTQLNQLFQGLSLIPPKHKHYSILASVRDKIAIELNRADEASNDNYVIYGKKYNSFSNIINDLSVLLDADYQNKTIHITYEIDKHLLDTDFSVGAVVYSAPSDAVYIIGKADDILTFIPLANVKTATPTSEINTEYITLNSINERKYRAIINTMLDISVEEPTVVKAELVADFLPTQEKIKQLYLNRNKDKVQKSTHAKTVEYEDLISDVENIEPYLLGYGKACKILEPDTLKNKFVNTFENALEMYKQEGFDV